MFSLNIFKKKYRKRTIVYLSTELNFILIVALCKNKAGIYCETQNIQRLSLNDSDEVIGKTIKEYLDLFELKVQTETVSKLKDWPAYKASELKSVKEFERTFQKITIYGLNSENLFFEMIAETDSKYKIDLTTTISAFAADCEYGQRLKRLHQAQVVKRIE